MDRVEAAFTKFDTDGNGYIDWEEFKEVIRSSHIHTLFTKIKADVS